MKAILLAGGTGSRLFPSTLAVSKQLLPVYDKPMIYYPLSVVMIAGIRDILLISTPGDICQYERLLGDGTQWGLSISYCVQEHPRGLADAFILGEDFIGDDDVCLVLGDNVFYGMDMGTMLAKAREHLAAQGGACVFACSVSDPKSFGVVEFDETGNAISLEEKPLEPKSNYAVTGLYFYDNSVCSFAKTIQPSARGELEITSINNIYMQQGKLHVIKLKRGMAWLDTGTPTGCLSASQFVETVQNCQGLYVACLEEIAYHKGWIDQKAVLRLGERMKATDYGQYVLSLANP